MKLPQQFLERMKNMLGDEYEAFLAGYENSRKYGLRVNSMKITPEEFGQESPFSVEPLPWISEGFSYGEGAVPARHPWYAAGVYYLQEPSAMTPASRLPVTPGERVLDLCAAPGGKATALAAALRGEGVLTANDISASRCKALLRNLELFGASNVFVTNETPERLEKAFPGYFDKILVDAPCSGEGMFRKSQEVADDWSPEKVEYFAAQQRNILKSAAAMLRPGGMLLYSTCTFAPAEDEGSVEWLLEHVPGMEIQKMEPYEGFGSGRPEWIGSEREELRNCVRIWPHRMNGEGHFLALLKKAGGPSEGEAEGYSLRQVQTVPENERRTSKKKQRNKGKTAGRKGGGDKSGFSAEEQQVLEAFLKEQQIPLELSELECRNGHVYKKLHLPEETAGLRFLRRGLYLGECKKGRFEPSQPLALSLGRMSAGTGLSLKEEDSRLDQFLRGESIAVTEEELQELSMTKGWILVGCEGFPVGWGKLAGTVIKNKIPAGWRKN